MAAALAHGNIAAWYPGDHTAHEVQHPPALYLPGHDDSPRGYRHDREGPRGIEIRVYYDVHYQHGFLCLKQSKQVFFSFQ